MDIPKNAQLVKEMSQESVTLTQSTDTYMLRLSQCLIEMDRCLLLPTVHLEKLDKTIVILGHVEGSLFIQHLTHSIVIASCRQVMK
jgi:hypothetical protein